MDELKSGSYADSADLSKTFDSDETFDKVKHTCRATRDVYSLSLGSKCPHCGEVVQKPK